MIHELSLKEIKKEWHGTLKSYVIGFTASIILTMISFFFLVITKSFSERVLIHTLIILALVQAIVQLRFFLHLGQEAKPWWETLVFCFMVVVLLIIAFGSLWIMGDLNERVMPPMPMDTPSK